MSKALRRKMVDELAEKIKGQQNMVLIDANGLTGNQSVELRKSLRESKAKVRLVKNSVALHTFKKLGIAAFEKHLTGMSVLVYGADPLAMAKKLVAYKEKHQKGSVKAAVIEGKAADASAIGALAKLPGREEMLGQILGLMQGATVKLVSTLNEIPRKFVGTLQAIADKEKS
ncbi:MAG TPA: 50S ribosomal protein L10 [Planctomycetota bacterium]|nr:50S ribosomal protein L10 [Planctomycetota bacterium]